MKQSAAVMTPDFWLCYGCLGHSGKLPSCWKQLGKLPEVQRVAQVGALMAVRLQNLWQEFGKPWVWQLWFEGFKALSCWFVLLVIMARWLSDAECGKVGLQQHIRQGGRKPLVFPTGICLSWEDVTPFLWDINTSVFCRKLFQQDIHKQLLEKQWGLDTKLLWWFWKFHLRLKMSTLTIILGKHRPPYPALSPVLEVEKFGLIQFAFLLCSLSILTFVLYIPINFKIL